MLSAAAILMAFGGTFSTIIVYALIGVTVDLLVFRAMLFTGAKRTDADETAQIAGAIWPVVLPFLVLGLALRVAIRLVDAGLAVGYWATDRRRPDSHVGRW